MNIAVIGTGSMGAPIARALAASGNTLSLYNRTPEKARRVAADCHGRAEVAGSAADAARGAEMVVLAVKPHLILEVMAEVIAAAPSAAIVSLAPGISLADMQAAGAERPLRLMPNVAIACGAGISFISAVPGTMSEARALQSALESTGSVHIVGEREFEPLMALTSCGIAFALRYVRAAVEGAVALGLRADDATAYTASTIRGAAALLEANPGLHAEALIDSVTTPGGSTIRGLLAMERAGFSPAVADALFASSGKTI